MKRSSFFRSHLAFQIVVKEGDMLVFQMNAHDITSHVASDFRAPKNCTTLEVIRFGIAQHRMFRDDKPAAAAENRGAGDFPELYLIISLKARNDKFSCCVQM